MLDGILLEKAGVPTISIVTEPFKETGAEMAKILGVEGFKFLLMPHPIANLHDDELTLRAKKIVEQVLWLLKTGQTDQ